MASKRTNAPLLAAVLAVLSVGRAAEQRPQQKMPYRTEIHRQEHARSCEVDTELAGASTGPAQARYTLKVHGEAWLRSAPPFVLVSNSRLTVGDGLRLQSQVCLHLRL